jgi:DNA-binding beta-propeller fold protein YncE
MPSGTRRFLRSNRTVPAILLVAGALLIAVPFVSSASMLALAPGGPYLGASTPGLVATCAVTGAQNAPYPAYDPVNHQVYVPTLSTLVVLNTCAVGKVALPPGVAPAAAVFDPQDNELYVTDANSNQIDVIQGSSVLATIASPSFNILGPLAFDPAASLVAVSNGVSNTVVFISGTTVIGSTPVGVDPGAIGYDPAANRLLVTNAVSANVTSIDAANPIGTPHINIPVGGLPQGIVFDVANHLDYVANGLSDNVSVIDGLGGQHGSINVCGAPFGETWSQATLHVYVTCLGISDPGGVSVISSLSVVKMISAPSPSDHFVGAVYDEFNDRVYITAVDTVYLAS